MKKKNVFVTLAALAVSLALCASPAALFAATDAALFSTTYTQNARRGSLSVTLPAGLSGTALCTVTAADGRTVARTTLGAGRTTLATALPAGTYVLYLRCGSEARVVKFVK